MLDGQLQHRYYLLCIWSLWIFYSLIYWLQCLGKYLIAEMFNKNEFIFFSSKRYDEVYNDTKNIWHSQQYLFTREYYTRSPFFPPITFFYDVYNLSRMGYFAIRRICLKKSSDPRAKVFSKSRFSFVIWDFIIIFLLEMIPTNKDVIQEWYEFEGASTYEYAHAEVKAAKIASTT